MVQLCRHLRRYLEGFLNGWTEGTLRALCKMKQAGMPSDVIAACTDVSLDVVEMITVEKRTSTV